MAVGEIVVDFHDRKVGLDKDGNFILKTGGNIALGSTPVEQTATPREINRVADVSGRLVAAGATLAVTEALHDGKIILLDTAAGSICTLPAASGSGARFRFQISIVATSNSHIVKVANASDTMVGQILSISDDAGNTVKPFFAAGTDDTITLNRTTTGSTRKAEWVEVIDIAANLWHVDGVIAATGTEATPFSATV